MMKQCKECCRDITEDDSKEYNGYCKNCYKEFKNIETIQQKLKEHGSNIQNEYNIVARIIKVISIIISIIGVIYGLSMLDSWRTEELAFPIIIGSIVITIFVYGYGEIIQLLEDIKNK